MDTASSMVLGCAVIAALAWLARLPAQMARYKGYGYWEFYALGLVLLVPALVIAWLLPDKRTPL